MSGPPSPRPDGGDDPLAALYEDMPAEELARQGRAHLAGRADAQARRWREWLWRVVRAMLIGGVVGGTAFACYLLWQVQVAGQRFAAVREAVFRAYAEDGG